MTTPKRNQSLLQRSWSFPNAPPECDNTRERFNTKYVLPPLRSSSLSTDFFQTITTETTTSPLLPLLTDQNNNVQDLVNDEEASSLLEWKRQSILLRASVVIPGLSDDDDREREEEGEENDDNDECQDIADKLWKGDLVSEASFLGNVDPFSQCTLELYLAKYDFKDMQLDTAFRKLCQKVYFKAEAQEIDRVLEAFARRYWACNNNVVYGSADVIYAIIYSLMLLNTDLHIAKGHTKMSKLTFCRNTMETIYKFVPKETFIKYEYEIEILLKDLYNSVKQQGFMQPQQSQQQQQQQQRNNSNIPRTLLRRFGSLTQKEKNNSKSMIQIQKLSENVENSFVYLEGKMLCKAIPPSPFISSNNKLKQNNSSKRRRNNQYHERYRECWVSLGPGYLQIDQHYGARLGTKTSCHELFHAFAIPHAPSWYQNGPSPFGFLLQLPNRHRYIFSCDSKNQVITWIRLLNYWAARQSKIPLYMSDAVGNSIYFGWEPILLNRQVSLDKVIIQDWFPPIFKNNEKYRSMSCNNVDEQYDAFQQYRNSLRIEREHHVTLFDQIDQVAIGTTQWAQVHANWTAKKGFLDQQIQKYNAYLNAIQEQQKMPFVGFYDNESSWLSEMDLFKEISDELELIGSKPLL